MKLCLECGKSHKSDGWVCPSCGWQPGTVNGFLSFAAPESGDGFRPEYFAELAGLEAGYFWFRERNRLITECIRKYFSNAASFLEVGCGTAFVLSGLAKEFQRFSLHGTEYFADGLAYAHQRVPQALLMQADARKLPFAEEFDLIGSFDVLEHIEDDDLVLKQFHQALKPGGGILVTVPQHRSLWTVRDDIACHVRRYEPEELHEKIENAGFSIVMSSSFVSFLLPAIRFSRRNWKEDSLKKPVDPLDEYRISTFTNRMLETILSCERMLIRCGVRFPAGCSRIVAALKQ